MTRPFGRKGVDALHELIEIADRQAVEYRANAATASTTNLRLVWLEHMQEAIKRAATYRLTLAHREPLQ